MAEERKEPKVEGGFNISIGGFNLGNLLGGLFGNIDELLNRAERLANAKGDERAKEDVRKMKERLGKTGATREDIKTKGLGGVFSQILNFVEKEGGQEETQEFEIGGRKGVISHGIRIGGLGGSDRMPGEKFEIKRHEPKAHRYPSKQVKEEPVVEEKVEEPALDVFDEKDYVLVSGDMPGVNTEEIKYQVEGNLLTVWTKGARKYRKEIELPVAVNTEKIELSYNNGVLEVRLPKQAEASSEEKPKRKRGRPKKTA